MKTCYLNHFNIYKWISSSAEHHPSVALFVMHGGQHLSLNLKFILAQKNTNDLCLVISQFLDISSKTVNQTSNWYRMIMMEKI